MPIFNKILSTVIFVVFLAMSLLSVEELKFCNYVLGLENSCVWQVNGLYETLFFLITATMFPLLLSLPLDSRVFECWQKFFAFAIPLVLLPSIWLVYSDAQSGGGFMSVSITPFLIAVILIFYYIASATVVFQAWKSAKYNMPFPVIKTTLVSIGACLSLTLLFVGWIFLSNLG